MYKYIITFALLACVYSNTQAQAPKYRPDITTNFTPIQRQLLANLMQEYITASVIEDHCNHTKQDDLLPENSNHDNHIHDDNNFLGFHRAYIEGLEDFLKLKGYPEFVPLPTWDPGTLCPIEFQIIDADVSTVSTNCSSTTSLPTNWQPLARPRYLKQPTLTGNNTDLCDWNNTVGPHSITRVLEGEQGDADANGNNAGNDANSTYHNSVHNNMGGIMWNFKSPALLAFWIWHAYVDDIWKEYQSECTIQNPNPRAIDLYIKNVGGVISEARDLGIEPNWGGVQTLWNSPDIWVRDVQDDGLTTDVMENPEYHQNADKTWGYVRVRNRGKQSTTGNEIAKLYWAKAGTYQLYPKPWDGTVGTPAIGGLIGSQTVGVIKPLGQTILKFEWVVPEPSQFGAMDGSSTGTGANDGWHFCLLAKGDNPTADPDLGNMNNLDIGHVVANNNHIAWRNLTVVDFSPSLKAPFGKINRGTIAIGNLFDHSETFDFNFDAITTYTLPSPITKHAEVITSLNPTVWAKWTAGGRQSEGIKIYNEEKHQLLIVNPHSRLKNLTFASNEINTINVVFNFLIDDNTSFHNFEYKVTQKRSIDQEEIGGETYAISRPIREDFYANAGSDKTILENQTAQLTANTIGEAAVYNWYNDDGELIYTGKDLSVSPDITTKYKLKVISSIDGFKDYDEVTVKIKDNYITSLSPNPAINTLNLNYKLNSTCNSAYIIIMKPYGASYNYILNTSIAEKTIDITDYPIGNYNILLITIDRLKPVSYI